MSTVLDASISFVMGQLGAIQPMDPEKVRRYIREIRTELDRLDPPKRPEQKNPSPILAKFITAKYCDVCETYHTGPMCRTRRGAKICHG